MRNKAKQDVWVEQDAIRLQTREWVEEENAKPAAEILEKEEPTVDLANVIGCEITVTLEQLVQLFPRF